MPNKTTQIAVLGGEEVEGIEELAQTSVEAIFDGGDIQAEITQQTFRFTGEANQRLLELQELNPNEGPELVPLVTDGVINYAQKYWVLFNQDFRKLSDITSEATVQQDSGALTFQETAKGLTLQLLKQEGVWTDADAVNIPYIVENRKRLLEFLTLQIALAQTAKAIYDEVFKLINITSDIASGLWVTTVFAGVVAISNLISSLATLVLLTIQLVKLLLDTQKALFPPIRYHRGVNLLNLLRKGANYLEYDIEFGSDFEAVLEKVNLCPSKDDEVGPSAISVEFDPLTTKEVDQGDGLLKPNNFGYFYSDAINLTKIMFNTKVGIIEGVVHLRPQNDPFWSNSAAIELPDVLIEQALNYNNGTRRENYEDLISQYSLRYQRDDSDLHTLTDANNRVASFLTQPSTPINRKRGAIRGDVLKDIPYALCVRKPEKDNLFTRFLDLEKLFNTIQETLEKIYEEFPTLNEEKLPDIEKFLHLVFIKKGALLVENHFFSQPKIVILEETGGGLRIPEDFADVYGAPALMRNYHSWNFMVEGWKDPDDPTATNQKIIYENVTIPFGLASWDAIKTNSWFNMPSLGLGQFRRVDWNKDSDTATVDFHIFKTWNTKLKGQLVTVGPESTIEVE